jgi:hypothetical protein
MKNLRLLGVGLIALSIAACGGDGSGAESAELGDVQQAIVVGPTKAPQLGPLSGYVRSDGISAVTYTTLPGVHRVPELALVNGRWIHSTLLADIFTFPTPYVRADGVSAVMLVDGRNADNRVIEMSLSNGRWSQNDLTAVTGAPRPVFAEAIAPYVRSDKVSAVLYCGGSGPDSHVIELSLGATGRWGFGDLSAISGTAGPGDCWGNAPLGYVRNDGFNAVVYRRTQDGHIYELALVGGTWGAADLTAAAGAVPAVGQVRPYVRADGVSAVVYASSDKHIRELALVNGAWRAFDLTAASGAPLRFSGTDPLPYVRSDGVSAVLFVSSDAHIRELALSGGKWTHWDLTAKAGAPRTPLNEGQQEMGAYVRHDLVNAVLYHTTDGHVHELSLPKGGSQWADSDLTKLVGTL